jgi:hypothetical protein
VVVDAAAPMFHRPETASWEAHVRQIITCVLLVTLGVPDSLPAQELDQVRPVMPPVIGWLPETIAPPTIDYTLVFPEAESRPAATRPMDKLLGAITTWLVENFDLPVINELPQVELVPPSKIAALRYKGFMQRQPQTTNDQAMLGAGTEIMAVYDDVARTIYLPEGWSGGSAAELSVLVHEAVHHLQNLGQLKYQCPQEREKLAYAAQARWLGLFGRTLSGEFEVDPFTLLVQTSCLG